MAPDGWATARAREHQPALATQPFSTIEPNRERLSLLRASHLNQSVWDSYDAIVDACCRAWNAFIRDVDRVAPVARRAWASRVSRLVLRRQRNSDEMQLLVSCPSQNC